VAGVVLALAALAGCATGAVTASSGANVRPPTIPLATGGSAQGLGWATVATGGRSVGGTLWQLLVQDRADGHWRLATPPGVADNAGLAVAWAAAGHMTAGFIPSQDLTFTPLARTRDGGTHWSPGLFPGGLVHDPDSLAATPGGQLVAVTAKSVQESAAGGTGWTSLVTRNVLAATPAGRRCGLTGLTGAVAESDGTIIIAGTCSRPGAVGLFGPTAGGWQATGPSLPRSPGLLSVSVLGLMNSPAGTGVLLAAKTEHGQLLIPAWRGAKATAWSAGSPVTVNASGVKAAAASAPGVWGVVLGGRHALMIQPPGRSAGSSQMAQRLTLPASDATLVPGSGGSVTSALVPGATTVTVWQLTAQGAWHRTQVITVPLTPGGQSQ
jgi:hypothetical protein